MATTDKILPSTSVTYRTNDSLSVLNFIGKKPH